MNKLIKVESALWILSGGYLKAYLFWILLHYDKLKYYPILKKIYGV